MSREIYALPFVSDEEKSRTIYWCLYGDRSGGMFFTTEAVKPLASLLRPDERRSMHEYLTLHKLQIIGSEVKSYREHKLDYIKALGKPVLTKIDVPKIVW